MIPDTTNFKPIPIRKPKNDPIPARRDLLPEEPLTISPKTAPANGPIIIPKGPRKNPIISPIVAPHVPNFVPPNFFVPQSGII